MVATALAVDPRRWELVRFTLYEKARPGAAAVSRGRAAPGDVPA
ncbi:hypothetical protein ACFYOI_21820 [Streptomyces microflavus]